MTNDTHYLIQGEKFNDEEAHFLAQFHRDVRVGDAVVDKNNHTPMTNPVSKNR